ncbi:MAG: hypothetical protein JWO80_5287 [Bryobacterales bacterium]|nr:hypothetical protein [Bryobacterales bacterium]
MTPRHRGTGGRFLWPIVLLTLTAPPSPAADPVSDALARMDQNAAAFQGVSANINRVTHNAAVGVDHTETGTMLLKRPSPHDMRVLITFAPPDEKTVALQGEVADVYYPKINTVQEYQAGKYRDLFDQFFLLGFGSSGKELSSAYDITSLGEDTVGGEKALHLQLIPKSKKVRDQLPKVELWLSEKTGYPVQQKLYFPSGDYQIVTYSNLKVNPKIADSALRLKTPKGVQKVYPGK